MGDIPKMQKNHVLSRNRFFFASESRGEDIVYFRENVIILKKAYANKKRENATSIEKGKLQELMRLLEELYSEPVEIITINDLLWFEDDFVFEQLGITLEQDLTCSKSL